uniref:Uncharacterized protein n=1 Tax=Brassica campestris TaxID=3711 RepID=M4EMF9_BRACM
MGWWEASLNWLRRASKCGKTSLINVVEYNLFISKNELHNLCKTSRNGIPLLVLGNKMDEPGALFLQLYPLQKQHKSHQIMFFLINVYIYIYCDCRGLQLFTDREVCCFMISCKKYANIDEVFDWLLKHSKSNKFLSLLCCVPCSRLFSRVKQEFAPAAGLFQSGLVSI